MSRPNETALSEYGRPCDSLGVKLWTSQEHGCFEVKLRLPREEGPMTRWGRLDQLCRASLAEEGYIRALINLV